MKLLQYFRSIAVSLIFALFLHQQIMDITTMPVHTSLIVDVIGFKMSAMAYFLLGFSILSLVFATMQSRMRGSKWSKGIGYSFLVGVLWIIATVENAPVMRSNPLNELITGSCDFAPIMLLGILLSILIHSDSALSQSRPFFLRDYLLRFAVHFVILCAGRLAADNTGILFLGSRSMPGIFFATTLMLAAVSVTIPTLLYKSAQTKFDFTDTVNCGIILFGINWIMPVMWIPIIGNGYFLQFLFKVILDILLVTASVYVSGIIAAYTKITIDNEVVK